MPEPRAERHDVAIVGAGPAGLAAAKSLARRGVKVVVLEREREAGGVPRHCGHPPFGMREFGRILKGPGYAARLVDAAVDAGADIRTSTTVLALEPRARLQVTSEAGTGTIEAGAVLLATGVRETPRSARLIGGERPAGVMTTGALQSLVYLQRLQPFRRPVILGTELVSFSAILTLRHAAARPVAMVEPGEWTVAWRWSTMLPHMLRIPVHLQTEIEAIHGREKVEAVTLRRGSRQIEIETDGVVVTGCFRPESALVRASHLELDPATRGPLVDGFGRCSDPAYFAAGNLLRPVETAGWSWREGCRTADAILRSIEGRLPDPKEASPIRLCSDALRFVVPQRLDLAALQGDELLQLRVARPVRGTLSVRQAGREIWRQSLRALPERRVAVAAARLRNAGSLAPIELHLEEEK